MGARDVGGSGGKRCRRKWGKRLGGSGGKRLGGSGGKRCRRKWGQEM